MFVYHIQNVKLKNLSIIYIKIIIELKIIDQFEIKKKTF